MTTKADASMSPYERYEDELVTLLQMPGVDVKPLPKIEALELPRQTEDNKAVGCAWEAADAGDTTVLVKLNV